MYRLNKNNHRSLLRNAITATYKKVNKTTGKKISKEGNKLAKQADIVDKIEMNGTGNFVKHPATTLINPSKNEAERISKNILDQINTELVN